MPAVAGASHPLGRTMGGVTSDAPAAGYTAPARSPWLAPVLRAVPAVIAGLIITFTADHSPTVGLIMLSVYGLGSALVLLATAGRMGGAEPVRGLHRGLALVAAIAGGLALVVLVSGTAGLALLLLLVGGYAVIAGALELVWGIRHRDRSGFARDAVVIGVGTLALALVLAFVGDPVSAVGFFGAYAVMLGVYLAIAGVSLRLGTPPEESSAS